jgi:ATP-binding cassette, subfamily B, bacterial
MASSLFVPAAATAAGVWLGGQQVIAGELSAGALLAFVGWMALLVDAVQTLTERVIDRGAARAAADRLVPLLQDLPPRRPPVRAPVGAPAPGEVVVDGVSVDRGGRRVLDGVSLAVRAGEWVAVVGASGAGKSTLLRLLPRLGEPTAGTVAIGGADVARADPAALRRRVAYLGQGPVLLSGTVAENVRLARPGADDAALHAALDAADARGLVEELGGTAARVGTGGATLSGGQRQRLALARTLLARADVLVLDDVTSALDPPTEARVLAGLRAAAPGATVLLATHRLATALTADRVVVLEHGRVVQAGPPAEVLGDAGAGAVVLDTDLAAAP